MPPSSKRDVNLGKIGEARLDLIPQLAECNPGIDPIEYNVVLAPARMAEKIGSILLPDEARENEGLAMQVGRIVAQSPLAYSYERWPETARKPQPGDLVWFARYAGALFTGIDGQEYRIVKDKDIGALIQTREVAVEAGGCAPMVYMRAVPNEPDAHTTLTKTGT